jgi:hypothetical protein
MDLDVVERLVDRMQLAAVPALLDGLTHADDRTSTALAEMIVKIGAEAAPDIAARLDGSRAALQRILLSMLTKIGTSPEGFDLGAFTRHADGGVRREAFRALIRNVAERDDAIAAALADPDERIVRMALGSAMANCPPKAALALMARADDPTLSEDLRALGIRAASSYRAPGTLAFLVKKTAGKRRFLRRQALAAPTPEMLAALSGLATHWAADPAAKDILDAAAKSADKDIRDAVARRSVSMAAMT